MNPSQLHMRHASSAQVRGLLDEAATRVRSVSEETKVQEISRHLANLTAMLTLVRKDEQHLTNGSPSLPKEPCFTVRRTFSGFDSHICKKDGTTLQNGRTVTTLEIGDSSYLMLNRGALQLYRFDGADTPSCTVVSEREAAPAPWIGDSGRLVPHPSGGFLFLKHRSFTTPMSYVVSRTELNHCTPLSDGTWRNVRVSGEMHVSTFDVFPDGRVVAGGLVNESQIFSPAGDGSWRPSSTLPTTVTGGLRYGGAGQVLGLRASFGLSLWEPAQDSWQETRIIPIGGLYDRATALPDRKVAVADSGFPASVSIYKEREVGGRWSRVNKITSQYADYAHWLQALPNEQLLLSSANQIILISDYLSAHATERVLHSTEAPITSVQLTGRGDLVVTSVNALGHGEQSGSRALYTMAPLVEVLEQS